MIKFNLTPMGDRVLAELHAEPKKSSLILPENTAPQHAGRQRFFKITTLGTGQFTKDNFSVGDYILVRQGTEIPTFKVGKDLVTNGLIEIHQILCKVTILEGDMKIMEEEEMLSPEQVEALTKPIHDPN